MGFQPLTLTLSPWEREQRVAVPDAAGATP
jgi:hypothetical protein